MSKSTLLIIVGIILIFIACISASSIPLDANRDLKESLKQQSKVKKNKVQIIDPKEYVVANCHRRLLQNFYLGASGLICLTVGLAALPNKKMDDIAG